MHKLGAEMPLDLHRRSLELSTRASALLSMRGGGGMGGGGGHLRVPTVTLTSHRRGLASLPDPYRSHALRRLKIEGKTMYSIAMIRIQ